MLNLICPKCQRECKTIRGLQTHIERSHGTYEQKTKYRSGNSGIKCSCIICKKEINYENIIQHYNSHINKKIYICKQCGKEHNKNQKFCSHSCAAKYSNSRRLPKIKSKTKSNLDKPKFSKIYYCSICKKVMNFTNNVMCCSDICKHIRYSNMGKKSASKQVKRSKDEIKLFNLCKEYFNHVDHNIPIVDGWDADIIIYDIKTAILWNGPWHYKEMGHKNHSLKQVQNRDKIKIKELTNAGWNVLIFEDRYFTTLTAFEEIVSLGGVKPHAFRPTLRIGLEDRCRD